MRYRNGISVLGYGCMRLTRRNGSIDTDKAEKEILRAAELGVNYFDTAYMYAGNEAALGEILARTGIRDDIKVATKLPHYLVNSAAGAKRYFEEELKRLRTGYVDYYLMHCMMDITQWLRLRDLGIEDWIKREKEEGRIRNIGFSYHGNTDNFIKILDAYDWDICMIQYNYMDEDSQAGRRGLREAYKRGIPVIIMEPLRGGKLVDLLPDKAGTLIKEKGHTPAELALRWLWDQPEVSCVLSGMNSLAMVEENTAAASGPAGEAGNVDDETRKLITVVKDIIAETEAVGCTGCRYCMPCPSGVDIPAIFRCYNRMYSEGKSAGRQEYLQTVAMGGEPSFATQCVSCGRCEKLCPQSLAIREELKKADRKLRSPLYRIMSIAGRKYMLRHKKDG